jgi:hypothetical protein
MMMMTIEEVLLHGLLLGDQILSLLMTLREGLFYHLMVHHFLLDDQFGYHHRFVVGIVISYRFTRFLNENLQNSKGLKSDRSSGDCMSRFPKGQGFPVVSRFPKYVKVSQQ